MLLKLTSSGVHEACLLSGSLQACMQHVEDPHSLDLETSQMSMPPRDVPTDR